MSIKNVRLKKLTMKPNLFENEEASLKNLKLLLSIPVGFNSAKDIDPWHPSLMEIK